MTKQRVACDKNIRTGYKNASEQGCDLLEKSMQLLMILCIKNSEAR